MAQPDNEEITSTEDFLFNYHRSKLLFGLTLFEFDDAIKEGDGERLHDIYKFALLIFKGNGKTKYSYVILLYLVKLAGLMSQKDAHNLKWNRFYNKHGIKGGNIPLDLRMEHMNKIVKTMLVLCKLRVFHLRLRLRQKKLRLREKNSGSGRKHVKIEI